jgi:uncharacterized protein (TIGR03437 family)
MRVLRETITVVAVGIMAGGAALWAQGPRPPAIQSISICSPTGSAGMASCPSGTFDTQQIVLGASGSSINRTAGFGPVPDEHSSVFAPEMLGTNQDYLFFLATNTLGHGSIGLTVLSGGAGPGKNGQWVLDIPKADGYGSYPSGFGQVFTTAMAPSVCPTVPDGNPAHQDQTFDSHYASAGSVMLDPTGGPGSLLMIYEGVNSCIGTTGGSVPSNTNDYISLAVATSVDYGKSWPTYRGTPTFNFVPLPDTNPTQAPNAPMGAMGKNVCMGNDCATTPPANYGRYLAITPTTSLASLMAAGKQLTAKFGEQEIAGFVDDVSGAAPPYVYATFGNVKEGRARLNGGSAPLSFQKWDGSGFNAAGIGGAEATVVPNGAFENCEAPAQNQFGSSISYVEDTQQYLLTFLCISSQDPALGMGGTGNKGAAWFYSTSYSLADPAQWSAPREIAGSWSNFDTSGGCLSYNGFYPTFMSLSKKPAHLSTSGYVFYLWGCQGVGTPGPGRQFASRQFTITTAAAGPVLTTGSLANGATYASGGLVPGSWAQVKGTGLSPVSRIWGAADFQGLGNKLPTSLDGVSVLVNSLPAAVYFVDPGQIDFQVPSGVSGTASVQVTANGQSSNTITAAAAASSPGIFPVIVNGTNYPAGVFLDGKIVGDPAANAAFRKAKPGDVIQLFVTGLVVAPAGVLPTSQLVSGVTVTIGTATVAASFAGLVAVGEFQINFTVPQLSDGVYPMSIAVNGVASPENINTNPPGPLVIPIQH